MSATGQVGSAPGRDLTSRIARFANGLGVVLVLAMPVAVSVNVLSRFLFNRPFAVVFETVEYSMLWMTFLALPLVTLRSEHIRIDLVEGLIAGRPSEQRILRVLDHVGAIISGVVLLALTYFIGVIVYRSYGMGTLMVTTLQPPRWLIFLVIPVMTLLGAWAFLVQRVREVRNSKDPQGS